MIKNLLNNDSINIFQRQKYKSLINQINAFEDFFKELSVSEIKERNIKLKKQKLDKKNLNNYISESFALTREASRRTLGLRHFDVQLLGGLTLADGKIAEMRTGEGKTLVATLSAALNALTNKGVHIVTVNEYLANRDYKTMNSIYQVLGLNTGLIQSDMRTNEKKLNYLADITYVTNYELVFDFLRDNMSSYSNDIVLRPFNYCIIDEIDSILIDEARTPLILSSSVEKSSTKYKLANELMPYLSPIFDYGTDKKNQITTLKYSGLILLEKILSKNLYDINDPWIHCILNAIKAEFFYRKDENYLVIDDKIVIVDEFTGRIMPDRKWSDGIHQAVEMKEKLPLQLDSEPISQITYQSFFSMYNKLSGMTGTAKTSEVEFEKIYNLLVDQIPTANPNKRKDLSDLIYTDQFSKWNAVVQKCEQLHSVGQPILVTTKTVQKSEMLAQLLSEYKLSYELLNARPENVRRESEIIAQAGNKNSITISTNMAGRGTDITLGGSVKFKIQKKIYNILIILSQYYKITSEQIRLYYSTIKSKRIKVLTFRYLYLFYSLLKKNISQQVLSEILLLIKNNDFLKRSENSNLKVLNEKDNEFNFMSHYRYSLKFLIKNLNDQEKKNQKQKTQLIRNLGGLYVLGTERNQSRRIDNQLRGRCGRQGDPGISQFLTSLDDPLFEFYLNKKAKQFIRNSIKIDPPLDASYLGNSLDIAQDQIEEKAYQDRKYLAQYEKLVSIHRNILYEERKNYVKSQKNYPFFEFNELAFKSLQTKIFPFNYRKDKIRKLQSQMDQEIVNAINRDLIREDFFNFTLDIENRPVLTYKLWSYHRLRDNMVNLYGSNFYRLSKRETILNIIDTTWSEYLRVTTIMRECVQWRSYAQRDPYIEYKYEINYEFKKRIEILKNLIKYFSMI